MGGILAGVVGIGDLLFGGAEAGAAALGAGAADVGLGAGAALGAAEALPEAGALTLGGGIADAGGALSAGGALAGGSAAADIAAGGALAGDLGAGAADLGGAGAAALGGSSLPDVTAATAGAAADATPAALSTGSSLAAAPSIGAVTAAPAEGAGGFATASDVLGGVGADTSASGSVGSVLGTSGTVGSGAADLPAAGTAITDSNVAGAVTPSLTEGSTATGAAATTPSSALGGLGSTLAGAEKYIAPIALGGMALMNASSGAAAAKEAKLAAAEGTVGQQNNPALLAGEAAGIQSYNSGQITAPQQAQVDTFVKNQTNQLRQLYASSGRDYTRDTDYLQGVAQIQNQAIAMQQQFLNQNLQGALAEGGTANTATATAIGAISNAAQIGLQQDQNYQAALANAFRGLGVLSGSGTGGTTIKIGA